MSDTTGYAIDEGNPEGSVRITVNGQEICRARLVKLALMYIMLHRENAKLRAESDALVAAVKDAEAFIGSVDKHEVSTTREGHAAFHRFRNRNKGGGGSEP